MVAARVMYQGLVVLTVGVVTAATTVGSRAVPAKPGLHLDGAGGPAVRTVSRPSNPARCVGGLAAAGDGHPHLGVAGVAVGPDVGAEGDGARWLTLTPNSRIRNDCPARRRGRESGRSAGQ